MSAPHADPYGSILDCVGWTPLVRLHRVVDGAVTPVYGKCEFMNPAGSVKDRIGLAMIEAAEEEGTLEPGGVVVEGTSGNTGIGLAMAAAIKGYRCIFTMPDKMSQEKVRLLRAFGAEVVITPTAVPPDHPDHYVETAKRIVEETPGAVLADQFFNPANPEAHYRTTGPEIWEQTDGRVTHLVASAGTGGTITGAGRYLKERNPDLEVIAGDPAGSVLAHYYRTGEKPDGHPYKVEGIGNEKIPGTLDFEVLDDYRTVGDREAFLTARRLTREEGLFVGGSAGLITWLAVRVAHEVQDPDALVVCILCDTGERYLSKLYSDEWMRENQFLGEERLVEDLLRDKEEGGRDVIAVGPSTPVREALALITEHDVSQLPVLADDDCVGSVSDATLMSRVIEEPTALDEPVEDLMEAPFPVIDSHLGVSRLGHLLTRENPAVLVREDGEIAGIVTRYDLIRTVADLS